MGFKFKCWVKMTYPSRDLNPRSSCNGTNPFPKFLFSDSISISSRLYIPTQKATVFALVNLLRSRTFGVDRILSGYFYGSWVLWSVLRGFSNLVFIFEGVLTSSRIPVKRKNTCSSVSWVVSFLPAALENPQEYH